MIHEGRLYLYATRDPWGGDDLACFSTEDFQNWETHALSWPTKQACASETGNDNKVWAPSVVRTPGGRFVMYVSIGSEIFCGSAPHPAGPWTNLRRDGTPLLRYDSQRRVHVIDGEAFIDDDGKAYLYWGSGWDWKNGHCLAAELAPDMASFAGEPREITPPGYFEAPFMMKQSGRYY
ncbi:MAG: family 43 glycosylhydrolase, partial [Planctomycetales bacterium]|nr:family 43 glycosylhydrolase [Planctomycetales bacterium]